MLDDESDWNNLDEEAKMREANEDFNADEAKDGGLDAYFDCIKEYQVFIMI